MPLSDTDAQGDDQVSDEPECPRDQMKCAPVGNLGDSGRCRLVLESNSGRTNTASASSNCERIHRHIIVHPNHSHNACSDAVLVAQCHSHGTLECDSSDLWPTILSTLKTRGVSCHLHQHNVSHNLEMDSASILPNTGGAEAIVLRLLVCRCVWVHMFLRNKYCDGTLQKDSEPSPASRNVCAVSKKICGLGVSRRFELCWALLIPFFCKYAVRSLNTELETMVFCILTC